MEISLTKKFIAELIGTFSLVLIGCGAMLIAGADTTGGLLGIGMLGVALAFGFTVLVMNYAIGGISGCHINPAVTLGMLVAGRIKGNQAVAYLFAQFLGSMLASMLLILIARGQPAFVMGEWALDCNGWGDGYQGGYNTTSAFVTEAIFTFMFLFVVLSTSSRWGNKNMSGLATGLFFSAICLVAIPITGASFNPARSFGPAVFAGGKALSQLWLFFAAPIAGALLAALIWRIFDSTIE